MACALRMREAGFRVTLLEASHRLGGKAGNRGSELDGVTFEHGYHFFPGWYSNTRALLAQLGVPLRDLQRWHFVPKRSDGAEQPWMTAEFPRSLWSLRQMWKLLSSGAAPVSHLALYYFFVLSAAATKMTREQRAPTKGARERNAALDRISRIGLLRDKWFGLPEIADLDHEHTMKASAIPAYEVSAYTIQVLTRHWLEHLEPWVSMLEGDLDQNFIRPFQAHLERVGVDIRFGHRLILAESAAGSNHLAAVDVCDDRGQVHSMKADVFVLATPIEVTRRVLGPSLHRLCPDLGRLQHVESAPMAALHILLRSERNYPIEHAILHDSNYGLSVVDFSRTWKRPRVQDLHPEARTYLSFIAADFVAMRELGGLGGKALRQAQFELLLEEIGKFFAIERDDIVHWELYTNEEAPLLINTVGAWPNRPRSSTPFFGNGENGPEVANLFFAGDWVKNQADLATMEGAVASGGEAARAASDWYGRANVRRLTCAAPLEIAAMPTWKIRMLVWMLSPCAVLLLLWIVLTRPLRARSAVRKRRSHAARPSNATLDV